MRHNITLNIESDLSYEQLSEMLTMEPDLLNRWFSRSSNPHIGKIELVAPDNADNTLETESSALHPGEADSITLDTKPVNENTIGKFAVRVEEALAREFSIDAKSSEEAIDVVDNAYSEGKIILYPEDHFETKITDVTNQYSREVVNNPDLYNWFTKVLNVDCLLTQSDFEAYLMDELQGENVLLLKNNALEEPEENADPQSVFLALRCSGKSIPLMSIDDKFKEYNEQVVFGSISGAAYFRSLKQQISHGIDVSRMNIGQDNTMSKTRGLDGPGGL